MSEGCHGERGGVEIETGGLSCLIFLFSFLYQDLPSKKGKKGLHPGLFKFCSDIKVNLVMLDNCSCDKVLLLDAF